MLRLKTLSTLTVWKCSYLVDRRNLKDYALLTHWFLDLVRVGMYSVCFSGGKGEETFYTYSFVSLSDVEHFLFAGSHDLVRIKRFANWRSKRVKQGCKDLSL